MKYIFLFTLCFSLCIFSLPVLAQEEPEGQEGLNVEGLPNADELVTKADELLRGKISSAQLLDFIVIRPDRKIERTFLTYLKGVDLGLAQFLAPLRDRNITSLKRKYDLWLYEPKIQKTLRIPVSMMHEGFMGSDFTYDDVIKAATLAHDYSHKIIGISKKYEEKHGKVYVVDLTPLPDRPITYPKLRLWIREQGTIILRQAFYDDQGKVVRVLVYDDIKEVGGRTIPTRQTMLVLDKKGYQTVLHIKDAEFDKDIDEESTFSQKALTDPPKPKFEGEEPKEE